MVDLDPSRLKKAPTYTSANVPNWSDRTYGTRIDELLQRINKRKA